MHGRATAGQPYAEIAAQGSLLADDIVKITDSHDSHDSTLLPDGAQVRLGMTVIIVPYDHGIRPHRHRLDLTIRTA